MKKLPLGSTRPTGWVLELMDRDWSTGFVGHLDRLVPSLFDDDIYGSQRLTNAVKTKDVGATTGVDNENSAQFLWWNSETQSNWRDGWLKHALLVGGAEGREAARAYVARILATQDADGYLGIYAPDLRYRFSGENGELWAQATLLRGLLAYHDATGDEAVLAAVVRAVDCTRRAWPLPRSRPFDQPGSFAGNAHGLMVVDVLDQLAILTGDATYLDYAILLYEDYCQAVVSEPDCQLANLLNPRYRFSGHGVHTWEHLRAVVLAATHAKKPGFRQGLKQFLERLERCQTPSGAPIGDEWIAGREADADETGYEYCSLLELFDGYSLLLAKTGDLSWADGMEHLLFNAGLGARHPHENSIAYLKTDNSFSMTGVKHHDRAEPDDATQTRYRYSPVHQEAAVCCVPNAGRLLPNFVASQVQTTDEGLAVVLFGPGVTRTTVNGVAVELEQVTTYPDELAVRLRVTAASPVRFVLTVRKPGWDTSTGQDWRFDKTWVSSTEISVRFEAPVEYRWDRRGQTYFQRGPLVYALPFGDETSVTRQWPFGGFRELSVVPTDLRPRTWQLAPGFAGKTRVVEGSLQVPFVDPEGREHLGRLVPMKNTVLRKVTFESSQEKS